MGEPDSVRGKDEQSGKVLILVRRTVGFLPLPIGVWCLPSQNLGKEMSAVPSPSPADLSSMRVAVDRKRKDPLVCAFFLLILLLTTYNTIRTPIIKSTRPPTTPPMRLLRLLARAAPGVGAGELVDLVSSTVRDSVDSTASTLELDSVDEDEKTVLDTREVSAIIDLSTMRRGHGAHQATRTSS